MTPIRTTLAALGLAVAMLTASAGSAIAGDGDLYAASAGAGAGAGTEGTVTAVDVPTGKGFRAAPQGGQQNITIVYSCNLLAAGAQRTQVSTCLVITDQTSRDVSTRMIYPGGAATESGTITLPGSRVRVCMNGFARDAFNVLVASRGACTDLALDA